MASLLPTHPPLLHHPSGSALAAVPSGRFRQPSSFNPALSSIHRTKAGFSSSQHELASPADFEFEAPLKVLKYPDPKLRKKNKRIATFDDSTKKLVHEMFDVMYKTDGIGLSAPQVGVNVQLMVFNPVGERGEGEEIVLINPKVRKYSMNRTLFNEGCLSFPGINADVKRPESVKIDARDVNGVRFSINMSGLPARIFQHEFDHLEDIRFPPASTQYPEVDRVSMGDPAQSTLEYPTIGGILFFERMTDEVLDSIRAQLQALEMKYEEMTGFPSPEKIESRRRRKAAIGFGKS